MFRANDCFGDDLAFNPAASEQTRIRENEMGEQSLEYGSSSLPPIKRVASEVFPLSFCQEGFWALEQLIPGNSFSNLVLALRLTGEVDASALERSFAEIVRRHAILRTRFEVSGDGPIQVVAAAARLAIDVEDLSKYSETQRETEFFRRAVRDFRQPFDFTKAPLFRVKLYELSPRERILVETLHHVIGDSWSLQILNRELVILYEAYSTRRPSPLSELSIQYADFAVWERRLVEEGAWEKQRVYWTRKLEKGTLPIECLPVDFDRSTQVTFASSYQTISFSPELSHALKSLGHQETCTVFMVLLSVCKILLSKTMGQFDIRVGTVVAMRKQSQIEELIGAFINTLLLRTNLSGDLTIREVLQQVRSTVLEAFDHQDLPFEEVVKTLEQESNLDRSALFRVLFLFEGSQISPMDLAGLTIEPIDIKAAVEASVTVTTFDLVFTFREMGDRLEGILTYKTALFKPQTILSLLNSFGNIAEQITRYPEVPLTALTL